ncbi:phosphopantetheine-binding protein [Actinocrispum sp. NPDC049592]|uniref:phosphopantetheine-binding protein n=1 Tax=Actinocrispum sp. NPDC049592 TaxID=3154835 RepID=UPI003421537E
MTTIDGFVTIVRDELGLAVTADNVGESFDRIPGWDSVHLLALLVILERESSVPISMPSVLQAGSLREIYQLTVAQ